MDEPSLNGRAPSGRLLPGHQLSVGNKGNTAERKLARRVRELKMAELEAGDRLS
jgi:hypothetical protein